MLDRRYTSGKKKMANDLVGDWAIERAPLNTQEASGKIYLRFAHNGSLQWGFENQCRTCLISFEYRIEEDKILTIRAPNPRTEVTPYSIGPNGHLTLAYSNYETIWTRVSSQNFFENTDIWDPGDYLRDQLDYLSLLEVHPGDMDVQRARYLGIDPQILVNTHAMSQCWRYSREPFASFHLDDFEFILDQGVLIDDDDNEDRTLLTYLAEDGHTEGVRLMLDRGADINRLDIYPYTPLDYADGAGRSETAALLRERGAKLASELD